MNTFNYTPQQPTFTNNFQPQNNSGALLQMIQQLLQARNSPINKEMQIARSGLPYFVDGNGKVGLGSGIRSGATAPFGGASANQVYW